MAGDVVVLSGDELKIECYPDHGFTIGAIRLPSGQNLLWNPRGASVAALATGGLGLPGEPSIDSFDQGVLAGGWFAMFPAAGPPGEASDQWMHGEVARLPWSVTSQNRAEVTCRLHTPESGFDVTRTVSVDGSTVRITMEAVNRSGRAKTITFGEHPCFPREVFAGGSLLISPTASRTTDLADPSNALLDGDSEFAWPLAPSEGVAIDLSLIPEAADGRHDHLSVSGLISARLLGNGVVLELRWDGAALPHAVIWEHFRPSGSPWEGDVFAVEPSSSLGRTYSEAHRNGSAVIVEPGGEIRYWITLSVIAP